MNTARIYPAAVLAAALMTTGCASYRQRVADDFRDAVKVNAGIGFGLSAHAKATSFLDAGLGWGGYWKNVGLDDRYTDLLRESLDSCPFPIGAIPGVIPEESPLTFLRMGNVRGKYRSDVDGDYMVAGQLFDGRALVSWDVYGTGKKSPHQVMKNDDPTFTEQPCGFEAGIGVVALNANIGFDPVEFVDFLGTVCGLDILHDHAVCEATGSAKDPPKK